MGAGKLLTTGSDNLYLGHAGVGSESSTLRLGSNQTRTFGGTALSGNTVVINSAGQLGVLLSSSRYKQDIQAITGDSRKVYALRPVMFHYKTAADGPLQYGLIAEEVVKVFPDLVTYNAEGVVQGVCYEALTPLLLKELQEQHRQVIAQEQKLGVQEQQLETQAQQMQIVLQQVAEIKLRNDRLHAKVEQMQGTKTVALAAVPRRN